VRHENDEGHVEYPGTCAVAKFTFSHPIEKELQEPRRPCKGGENIIVCEWCFAIRIVRKCLVPCVEDDTPDEVCCESSPKQNNVGDVVLKQRIKSRLHCCFRHRLPCLNSEVEACTQYPGDGCDNQSLDKAKLCDTFFLLGFR